MSLLRDLWGTAGGDDDDNEGCGRDASNDGGGDNGGQLDGGPASQMSRKLSTYNLKV